MSVRALLVAVVSAGLTACATPIAPPLPAATETGAAHSAEHARWTGHLSLRLQAFGPEPARGVSLTFDLQGQPDSGALDLSTPLGTLVASVRWTPQGASLYTADGAQAFDTLDDLVARVLGEPLPVRSLLHWLQAPPGDFEAEGWRVDTRESASGVVVAHRAASPSARGATLKIRLDRTAP